MALRTPKSGTGAESRAKARSGLQQLKYLAINFFLVFHIVAITFWCIPAGGTLLADFREMVRPYFVWSGLFQSWDMFSPTPKTANGYIEAVVIFEDGSSQLWAFPRMELMSLWERNFKERYRKYEENLQNSANSELWPDAAREVARVNSDATHSAKRVMLVVRLSAILPRTDGAYDRGPWVANVFYTYDVKPEDLK